MRIKQMYVAALALLMFVSGNVFAQGTPPYNRTVIVPSTGNATADGTAFLSALANLNPAPSSANRWLVKLDAGTFDVGGTPVQMREYVDIEGSGILETTISGSVSPPFGSRLGGLVEGANRSEIRLLTISCTSNASNTSCQAMSLDEVSPRLTQLRILVQGSGSGSHWGIRTYNSGSIIDQLEVQVTAATTGGDNYGIVYGGNSTMNIRNSSVVARNAAINNWAIVLRDDINYSLMFDSRVTGIGGQSAAGIMYLSSVSSQHLLLDDVGVSAYGGTTSIGIASDTFSSGNPKIWFRGGRLYGATDGLNVFGATARHINTEISGTRYLSSATHVKISLSHLDGGGTVDGVGSEVCSGVSIGYQFSADQCP